MGIGIILVGLEEPLQRSRREPQDIQRYLRVVTHPTVIRFLPAWIGLNAIMGAWLSQTTFQLSAHPISTGQMLLGRFSGTQIGLILACFAILFAVGTVVWGLLIGRLSKMTILLLASLGIYLCCMALLIINHPLAATPASLSAPVLLAVVLLGAGIFVQSGFTPAAFAYLADLSEKFRAERGAIIGVYYLFLSGGQLLGIWLGGISAQLAQVDGLILLSAALVSVVFATLLLIRARTTRG
jgi:MFS family permease